MLASGLRLGEVGDGALEQRGDRAEARRLLLAAPPLPLGLVLRREAPADAVDVGVHKAADLRRPGHELTDVFGQRGDLPHAQLHPRPLGEVVGAHDLVERHVVLGDPADQGDAGEGRFHEGQLVGVRHDPQQQLDVGPRGGAHPLQLALVGAQALDLVTDQVSQ